ncbi:MAG: glutamate--cysteine ligase, partial [Hyphomonadaceae bacterium]
MADVKSKSPSIENFTQLVEHLESGAKPKAQWRVGTEHEKFVFRRADRSPVSFEGPNGIAALLDGLAEKYAWQRVYEGESVIALRQAGASITLEPAGQFELSGAPLESLHETNDETETHLRQVRDVAGGLGLGFLALGFSPKWSLDETPIMPKARYKIMREYMMKVGRLGRQMMFRSCTVQANLDFGSEADMRKKFRVSLALQPIATALFANSPFAEGRLNGHLSYRGHVWSDTDPDRTGMLPFVFEDGFGFERYADYALDVPMYFVYRDGRYINTAERSFRDFLKGKLPELPGEKPTLKDWEDHLTTLSPEVRLKTYLEMRGADTGPAGMLSALPAFWTGIFD